MISEDLKEYTNKLQNIFDWDEITVLAQDAKKKLTSEGDRRKFAARCSARKRRITNTRKDFNQWLSELGKDNTDPFTNFAAGHEYGSGWRRGPP